jgi:hypothetical protein
MASPIPIDAPVITTTLPDTSIVLDLDLLE